jgi:hypothetical protein
MACDEMDLFYRYLEAYEEEKRRNQPWQCEVTVFSQDGAPATPRVVAAQQPSASPFKCDESE